MGRVHKKKLAEYTEATNNEINKKKNIDEKNGGSTDTESIEQNEPESSDEEYQSTQGDNASVKSTNSKRGKKRRSSANSEEQTETANNDDADKSENGVEEPVNGNGNSSGNGNGNGNANSKKIKIAKSSTKSTSASSSSSSRSKKSHKKKTEDKQEKESVENDDNDDEEEQEEEGDEKEEENDDETPQEEYEVQDVVDYKVERGVPFYLIRWKGYTKNDDTWEPESTLSCPELIEKFKKKQQNNKPKKTAPTTTVKKSRTAAKKDDGGGKIDPEQEWEVDKIINYSDDKGKRVFLIRWKGFSAKYDTWEPEANLSCDEIIDKFMKRIKSQENITFKELREEPKRTKRLVNETSLRTNYTNPIGRKSKRAVTKQRVYYGDSDA